MDRNPGRFGAGLGYDPDSAQITGGLRGQGPLSSAKGPLGLREKSGL